MKILTFFYQGKLFLIRELSKNVVNDTYVKNLKKQNFLTNNLKQLTKEDQTRYVDQIRKDKNKTILGIFHNKRLIGTSGAQYLRKKKIFIGIFLFSKKFLNKGLGFFFINLVTNYIYKFFNKKIFIACVYKKNIASIKSFKKAGFKKHKSSKKNVVCFQLKINSQKK